MDVAGSTNLKGDEVADIVTGLAAGTMSYATAAKKMHEAYDSMKGHKGYGRDGTSNEIDIISSGVAFEKMSERARKASTGQVGMGESEKKEIRNALDVVMPQIKEKLIGSLKKSFGIEWTGLGIA